MNIKSILKFFSLFIITLFSSSCEITDCNNVPSGTAIEDDCGVCVEGDTGLIANATMSCNGECDGSSWLWSLDTSLGDGICDYGFWTFTELNCEEHNCDNGDCGTWNGTQCMGPPGSSVIRYENPSTSSPVDSISTNDPSIPNVFEFDTYYPAEPGTYVFSYPNPSGGVWEGTYTTFVDTGTVNSSKASNNCFQLEFWNYLGPIFSNYNYISGCSEYWESLSRITKPITATNEKLDIFMENLEIKKQLFYEEYLTLREINKAENEKLRLIAGHSSDMTHYNSNPIVSNKIDYDRILEEVSSNANIKIQSGKNFILKYYLK